MDKLTEKYLNNYKRGFPYLKIVSPATLERGIMGLSESAVEHEAAVYDDFDGKVVKFVPASGAASRMFKDLFEAQTILERGDKILAGSHAYKFFANLEKFPFYDAGKFSGLSELEILDYILVGGHSAQGTSGLNYGSLPKGLIKFHKYDGETHTPFEEHMVEGALYAKGKDGAVHLHFTVSPEHIEQFKSLFEKVCERYSERYGCRYDVIFSIQDPATNIIAVNQDNTPFLKDDGTPLYRPGGHGALLNNLNSIDADIIILKNIDNVVRVENIDEVVIYKKDLCGVLLELKKRIFSYLRALDAFSCASHCSDSCDKKGSCESSAECGADSGYQSIEDLCIEIVAFLNGTLCVQIPDVPSEILPQYLHDKLNRPIRVCGMVMNEGEPGGGPFIVYDADGSTSLQILEKAQIDPNDPNSNLLFTDSTHFNPVDIVCCTKNYKGERFDLNRFVDPETGLISEKSYEGRQLKAQELPGLWNGSMSNWNTFFVQTPLTTFNPVKTVLDLLRSEHLGR